MKDFQAYIYVDYSIENTDTEVADTDTGAVPTLTAIEAAPEGHSRLSVVALPRSLIDTEAEVLP